MFRLIKRVNYQREGQAALTAVIFFLAIFLTVTLGFSAMALRQASITRVNAQAIQSYFLAEAGQEDATYRLIKGKMISASETITAGTASVTTDIVQVGNTQEITSDGDADSSIRRVKTVLTENTTNASFYYGVQVGDGGLSMDNNSQVNGNVYSNGSIIGDSGALITGDATVAGGLPASPTVEWTTHNADHPFATASTNRDIAQSFVATAGGALPQASVYLGKIGSPGGNITLRITNDNGNKPASSDITNATIANASVGSSPSWIDVSFTSPPTLVNGNKYWIVLDYGSNSATNYWNWRKDTSGGYAGNTGKYTSNWSSGGAVWTDIGADLAFRVWIGGTLTKIQDVTIGNATSGTGRANQFINTTIHGSSCPNSYCIVENPPRENMPLSGGVIQDWRDDATAGGTFAGDYAVTSDVSLGPKEITGDLLMTDNNRTLTVTGTIYVHGNIQIDNGSTIRCDPAYGATSCVILNDGWIHVKNNGAFSGSGTAGSFIMLLSTSSCDGTSVFPPCDTAHHNGSIDLHNNAAGAIFYAASGLLNLHNGVNITEATAYKLQLSQNASVTYESGLASLQFSSGPSGGYDITNWKEVE